MVAGNVVIELDLKKYTESIFRLYPQGPNNSWQWVLDMDGHIIINTLGADTIQIENLQALTDSVRQEASGMITNIVRLPGGKREKVYTAFYPLSVYDSKMGIMFSSGRGSIYKYYISNNILVSSLTLLLITALVVYLLLMLAREKKVARRLKLSETVLRQMIEHFPMGILVIDQKNIIRNIIVKCMV